MILHETIIYMGPQVEQERLTLPEHLCSILWISFSFCPFCFWPLCCLSFSMNVTSDYWCLLYLQTFLIPFLYRGRRGHDHMVFGLTTTCVISVYHLSSCEFEPCSWQDVLNKTLCLSVTCNRSVVFSRYSSSLHQ
jgi:hypothetical protein